MWRGSPVPFERAWATFLGAIPLALPLPINVAAFLSPPVASWGELQRRWWRDPFLAGRRYGGVLVSSLCVALLCAWLARRQARVRCATVRAVRFWTAAAFLLGPLGLAWMRLVVPWTPVEPVDGGRRAVHLERAPASDAPWPEPARTPLEVHA